MAAGKRDKRSKANRTNRKGVSYTFWLDTPIAQAFEEQVKRSRRTKTMEIEIALEKYLESVGLWPPSQEKQ